MKSISRRDFVSRLIKYTIASSFFTFTGCGFTPRLDGGLEKIAQGYSPFNKQNPNLRLGAGTYRTFLNTLINYGPGHTGIQYNAGSFYACASGKVVSSGNRTFTGNSLNTDSGDGALIMHGQDVFVDYYHMRTDSCKLKAGTYIKRGEFIGKEGAPHNMHLKLVVYRSDPSFVSAMG